MFQKIAALTVIACGGLILAGLRGKAGTVSATPDAPVATRPAAAGDLLAVGTEPAFLNPMDNLYENRLQVESSEYLSINLFNLAIDPAWAEDAAHYTIVSANDDRYAPGPAVHPTEAGSRTRAARVAVRKDLAGEADGDLPPSPDADAERHVLCRRLRRQRPANAGTAGGRLRRCAADQRQYPGQPAWLSAWMYQSHAYIRAIHGDARRHAGVEQDV